MITTKKSYCRICQAFCGIEVDVDLGRDRVLAVRGDRANPASRGYTCMKGRSLPEQIYSPDRLLSSKKRTSEGWVSIGAEAALDEIAERLRAVRDKYGPRSVAVYLGSNGHYTAAGGARMVKAWVDALGSTSFYSAASIDCPSKAIAAHRFYGGMAPNCFDIANADVTMFVGTNPLVSNIFSMPMPSPSKQLRDAQKRGMKLIVVDPRRSEVARRADLHLQIRPGEDATLLAGMLKIVIERKLYDRDYVGKYVSGVEDLYQAVKDFDLEYVVRRTEVPAELVEKAAIMFAAAKSGAVREFTGLTMSRHQNLTVQLCLTLNGLCGRIDRKGGVVRNPGVLAQSFPENPRPISPPLFGGPKARVRGLEGRFGQMPTATLSDEILLPGEGQIHALIVSGGNPVLAWPDQNKVVRALKSLDLLVCIDLYLGATAKFAHYALAPKHPLERPDMTQLMDSSYPMPFGQYTPAMVKGPVGLMEEWEMFWGLAKRLGLDLRIPGVSMDRTPTSESLLDAWARGSRIPLDEVRKHPSGNVFGSPELVTGGVVPEMIGHPDKKMAAGHPDVVAELREVRAEPSVQGAGYEEGESFTHRLISRRMAEVFNSTGQNHPSLRKRQRFNPAYMHPADMAKLGVKNGDIVIIDSGHNRIRGVVQGTTDIQPGVISMAHAWGAAEEHESDVRDMGSTTGRLTPDDKHFDPITGMPLFTAIPVNVYVESQERIKGLVGKRATGSQAPR